MAAAVRFRVGMIYYNIIIQIYAYTRRTERYYGLRKTVRNLLAHERQNTKKKSNKIYYYTRNTRVCVCLIRLRPRATTMYFIIMPGMSANLHWKRGEIYRPRDAGDRARRHCRRPYLYGGYYRTKGIFVLCTPLYLHCCYYYYNARIKRSESIISVYVLNRTKSVRRFCKKFSASSRYLQ